MLSQCGRQGDRARGDGGGDGVGGSTGWRVIVERWDGRGLV